MKTLLITLLFIVSHNALSQVSALEIMRKNNQQIKVNDETVTIDMKLINKKGQSRNRVITLTTQTNKSGEQNSLIKFSAPKNVSGTGLLTIEHQSKDDDQWLYLPALKRSRRISAANQTDPFMGTDFTYEDLSTEDLQSFNYELITEEKLEGVDTFKIKATPINQKEANASGYDHRIIWVRKQDHIVTKVNYFNKQKVLAKTLTASKIKPIMNSSISRAHSVVMRNVKTQHSTELSYGEYQINQGIQSNQFSTRSLERGW